MAMPCPSGSAASSTQFPLGLLRRLFRQATSVTSPAGIPLCVLFISDLLCGPGSAGSQGMGDKSRRDPQLMLMHVHRPLRLHEIESMISHVHRSLSVYRV